MGRFSFVAATPDNQRRQGVLEALDENHAVLALRRQGLVVVDVAPATSLSSIWAFLNREIRIGSGIKPAELASLTLEWGTLIEAGVKVDEALRLSLEGRYRASLKKILGEIRHQVTEGSALCEALAAHPQAFPAGYVALVQAAEAAGALGPSLCRMADDLLLRRNVADDVRNALFYPVFLFATASAAITVLLVVVVPNLESLYGDRDPATFPLVTRIVIAVSRMLRENGALILWLATGAACLILLLSLTAQGQKLRDRWLPRLPVFGAIIQLIEISRFLHTFSILLGGGVPAAKAMSHAVKSVGNSMFRIRLEASRQEALVGAPIADALVRSAVLPADALSLIRTGERTGQLAHTMGRAASIQEGARSGNSRLSPSLSRRCSPCSSASSPGSSSTRCSPPSSASTNSPWVSHVIFNSTDITTVHARREGDDPLGSPRRHGDPGTACSSRVNAADGLSRPGQDGYRPVADPGAFHRPRPLPHRRRTPADQRRGSRRAHAAIPELKELARTLPAQGKRARRSMGTAFRAPVTRRAWGIRPCEPGRRRCHRRKR